MKNFNIEVGLEFYDYILQIVSKNIEYFIVLILLFIFLDVGVVLLNDCEKTS